MTPSHDMDLSTPEGILQTALQRDEETYHFYGEMLTRQPVGILRSVVERLKDEEYRRIRWLNQMLSSLESGREILDRMDAAPKR